MKYQTVNKLFLLNLRCERCGIPYCSEDCYKYHMSKTRKDYCLPFRIRYREEVRILVASTKFFVFFNKT